MDRAKLKDAVDDWVAADIIGPEQGEAILAHHEPEDRSSRLITAVSVMGAVLIGAGALGAVAVSVRAALDRKAKEDLALAGWTAGGTLALLTVPALAAAELPSLVSVVLAHLLALVVVLVSVVAGYRFAEPPVVNVAVLAFLAVVLSFLGATVADALSGALALVIGGIVLLAVGLGLERGRRTLLDRMGGSSTRTE